MIMFNELDLIFLALLALGVATFTIAKYLER